MPSNLSKFFHDLSAPQSMNDAKQNIAFASLTGVIGVAGLLSNAVALRHLSLASMKQLTKSNAMGSDLYFYFAVSCTNLTSVLSGKVLVESASMLSTNFEMMNQMNKSANKSTIQDENSALISNVSEEDEHMIFCFTP